MRLLKDKDKKRQKDVHLAREAEVMQVGKTLNSISETNFDNS